MASFKDFIDKLFGKPREAPTGHSNQPVIHEMISRSADELEAYEIWKFSSRMERVLQFTKMEYHKNLEEENLLGATFFTFQQPAAKGFILNYRNDIFSAMEFQHYFDYLKEKILELNYKLYTSDSRSFNRKDHAETIERHYLKPKYQLDEEEKFVQQYGNIIITQIMKDDKPAYIKFMCNHYHDRKYTGHDDFYELIDHILHDV